MSTSTSSWTSWRRTSHPSSGSWKVSCRTVNGSDRLQNVSNPLVAPRGLASPAVDDAGNPHPPSVNAFPPKVVPRRAVGCSPTVSVDSRRLHVFVNIAVTQAGFRDQRYQVDSWDLGPGLTGLTGLSGTGKAGGQAQGLSHPPWLPTQASRQREVPGTTRRQAYAGGRLVLGHAGLPLRKLGLGVDPFRSVCGLPGESV